MQVAASPTLYNPGTDLEGSSSETGRTTTWAVFSARSLRRRDIVYDPLPILPLLDLDEAFASGRQQSLGKFRCVHHVLDHGHRAAHPLSVKDQAAGHQQWMRD